MEQKEKFVEFEKWCKKCLYSKSSESDDPCWECLENPVNTNSHKPVKFREKIDDR